MHDRTHEGSPLLGAAAAAGASRARSGGGGVGEGQVGQSNTRNQPRRECRQRLTLPGAAAIGDHDHYLSNDDALGRPSGRRFGAGLAGALMFSIALVGLVAIYASIAQEAETTAPSDDIAASLVRHKMEMKDAAAVLVAPPAVEALAVSESRDPTSNRDRGNARVGGEEEGDRMMDLGANQSQSKPNVFFIFIDDMGWNDMGYQSIDLEGVTPNLDKLAAGGVKMSNYYSMALCTPARASLMTGRYVVRYGMQYGLIEPGAPWGVPLTEKLFPEYMKDAGYETHIVGKWNLGDYEEDFLPNNRGFDSFMGFVSGEETYWSHQDYSVSLYGRKFFDFGFGNATGFYDIIERPLYEVRNGSIPVDPGDDDAYVISSTTTDSSSVSAARNRTVTGEYSTQLFQDRTMEILKEKTPFDQEPLYLYLAHQAVHPPLGLPPDGSFSPEETAILDAIEANSIVDGGLRKRFAKVLMYLDHTIGDLVDYLETEGWMENSIIVVTSDNGGCPKGGGSNYPLRGTKRSYFEGGFKVPAFIYSTSHIPQGRWGTEYDGLMHVTDWLPTLASGAGIDLGGGAGPLDGVDHWNQIVNADMAEENDSPRQELLYNFDPYTLSTTDDDISNAEYPLAQGAFRSGKYKLISNEWCSGWYTFDENTSIANPRTNSMMACGGSACSFCNVCTGDEYFNYLFDLEADPREENNLIKVYPEIAETLRNRWSEVALSEWTDSGIKAIDTRAYYVWAKYNWWIVPWWHQVSGVTEDPFGINSTSSTSSTSLGGGEHASMSTMSSRE
ncbi:unnamed protein product [Pylaiella littoralis]